MRSALKTFILAAVLLVASATVVAAGQYDGNYRAVGVCKNETCVDVPSNDRSRLLIVDNVYGAVLDGKEGLVKQGPWKFSVTEPENEKGIAKWRLETGEEVVVMRKESNQSKTLVIGVVGPNGDLYVIVWQATSF
jgi:hypothetical protein